LQAQPTPNPYSFSVDPTAWFYPAVQKLMPDGKIAGKIIGMTELVPAGAPPRTTLPDAVQMTFALQAEGDMMLRSGESFVEALRFANNPTDLSLRTALIKIGPGPALTLKAEDGTTLTLPGPPQEVFVLVHGKFGLVRKGDELLAGATNSLPFSQGAKWKGVGTVGTHEWSVKEDVIQTNLLPYFVRGGKNASVFLLVAAQSPGVTVAFAWDGLENAQYLR
jgi:hypothetical protein